ncbi:MAG: bifunctional 4-hydroxy-3-methylbut-2-enyl diphosphate reductase/30S ribosomal protein S1 [Firmicutes bacterium]|nr:bifunctional 4-hydroxy-3-methylbut-2-enyl diphosphate reductase/30S ribosomal protein S1 [Bacillota bacterium]
MDVYIAENSGFCFGVKNAIDETIKILAENKNKKIYSYGPLIHNRQVIERISKEGLCEIQSLKDIENKDAILIIRSHGITKEILNKIKSLEIEYIDCTCPFVSKIHKIVYKYHKEGYKIFIAGDKRHPEVMGINGWCNNTGTIIQDTKIIDKLPNYDRICLVAQTTITADLWNRIVEKVKNRFKTVKIFNTRCIATEERQNSAKELSKKVDAMIVIGGYNSSNTLKLYEICKERNANTYHIETINELPYKFLKDVKSIGITAGASTPDWILKEVIRKMQDLNNEKQEFKPNEENQNESLTENMKDNEESKEIFGEGLNDNNENEPEIDINVSNEDITNNETNENIMEEYEKSLVRLNEGDTVKGTVLSLSDEEVIVNIGYKADGIISKEDLSLNNEIIPSEVLNIGDEIEVKVIRINDGEGNVILSRKMVELDKNFVKLETAFDDQTSVTGIVKEIVKGGGIVEIHGVKAFMPASLFDMRYINDLESMRDKEVSVKIIEFNKDNRRIIVSRKAHIIEERERLQKEFWDNAEEGNRIEGEVKRLTDFGAFVDIGGLDGLIHISELSWSRVNHPSEVLNPGDKVEVIILSLNEEKNKVSLGLKQTLPEPWTTIEGRYNIGDIIEVKIVRFANFGAFAEIEPGIDGLIHISQISEERIGRPSQVLKINEIVKVKIIDTNIPERKISLSIIEAKEEVETEEE